MAVTGSWHRSAGSCVEKHPSLEEQKHVDPTKTGYPTPAISSMSNDEEIDDHPKDFLRMATQYETPGVTLW